MEAIMHTCAPRLSEEERLIARCLQGENIAWDTMFSLYHPRLSLISFIECGCDKERAEEIAAAVWYSLCSRACSPLQRYDPQAGRLLDYLAGIARREIWKERRAKLNRHSRECKVARAESTLDQNDRRLIVDEFLATLTRREREFCLSDLLNQDEHKAKPAISLANRWQLRSRVLKKFRAFLFEKC